MQHYVGLRPMFDLEVMNADVKVVLGEPGSQPNPSHVGQGLSSLYNEITGMKTPNHLRMSSVYTFHFDLLQLSCRYCTERSSDHKSSLSFPQGCDVDIGSGGLTHFFLHSQKISFFSACGAAKFL